ncbi:MAG: hypothetical protein ACYDIE_13980 [Candidatus Krumholzibacteriia bacterium]
MDREARAALEALPVQPLLQESPAAPGVRLEPALRAELEALAGATDSVADRSDRLWHVLRKRLGQPEVPELLRGVVMLVRAGEPAGARLLAALLDVHAPGAEMIARIHRFDSTRRLHAGELAGSRGTAPPALWRRRLEEVTATCAARADELPGGAPPDVPGPRGTPPLPLLRRWLEHLLAELARHGDLEPRGVELLLALSRLEVDAYEERVSRAAGAVNPYLASAVSRLLPLLGQADSEVRAMREFIHSIEAGRAGVAFRRRLPRLHEALSPDERGTLLRSLEGRPELVDLLQVLRGIERNPVPMRRLAGAAGRLMALGAHLRARGLRRTDLDLLTAVGLAQRYERDGEVHLPLGADLAATVSELLAIARGGVVDGDGPAAGRTAGPVPASAMLAGPAPQPALPLGDAEAAALLIGAGGPAAAGGEPASGAGGPLAWALDGFRLGEGELLLRVPQEGRADRPWRHDLPVPAVDAIDPATLADALDPTALKRLVLANLDNVSVTTGFLRNARVTAIPGMVAAIVTRCRTARVLDVIANDRNLYSGFANKDVPRALLLSPCNIPVKSLSKFIHVKYVHRIDLQRMAKDRTGIRREVMKEIQSYLATLGGN